MHSPSEATASTTIIFKELIGTIDPFKPGDDWAVFTQRLELFFEANLIEHSRKVSVLLMSIGVDVYQVLRNLCNPQLPKAKSYDELINLLSKQFQPKSCVYRQRILFDSLKQGAESIDEWYAKVVFMATPCEFGTLLNARVKDKFVCGMRSGPILDRVCEEDVSAESKELLDLALNEEAETNRVNVNSNPMGLTDETNTESNNEELETPNRLKYTFFPNSTGYMKFKVRAPNDANIALATTLEESDPMYEVFIGGWRNTKSAIRKNRTKPDLIEVSTPNILNEGEFRTFWIRWDNNTISSGYENNSYPFISCTDNEHVPIKYVGVCTKGSWVILQGETPSDECIKSEDLHSPDDSTWYEDLRALKMAESNCMILPKTDDIELSTSNKLKYTFYPNDNGFLKFKVRASNNAQIALSTTSEESEPMYEVCIGGWRNMKSAIRKNCTDAYKVEVSTPHILDEDEFRSFWISWTSNTISAGYENNPRPFISWTDDEHVAIQYIGVCTGWGASGSWIIHQGRTPLGDSDGLCNIWVASSEGRVPPYGFVGGEDRGSLLYVARCNYKGNLLPGKYHAGYKTAYVPWNGLELELKEFEMLCNCTGRWVPCTDKSIPPNAINGGETKVGETLYIGRAYAPNGTIAIGKVQHSDRCCYIPYGGREYSYQKYEILIS